MKIRLALCLVSIFAVPAFATMAHAQDMTVRTKLSKFEPSVEVTKALRELKNIFKTRFSAGFYASAGSTVDGQGRPTGGFSALVNLPPDLLFKGAELSIGPSWTVTRDENDTSRYVQKWDGVAQLLIRTGTESSFQLVPSFRGGLGGVISFTRRF